MVPCITLLRMITQGLTSIYGRYCILLTHLLTFKKLFSSTDNYRVIQTKVAPLKVLTIFSLWCNHSSETLQDCWQFISTHIHQFW